MSLLSDCRSMFHKRLLLDVLTLDAAGVATNADSSSKLSIRLAAGIVQALLEVPQQTAKAAGQSLGMRFESVVLEFLKCAHAGLSSGTVAQWEFGASASGRNLLSNFVQFEHLKRLDTLAKENPELAASLGNDYTIKPDIVVWYHPLDDSAFNQQAEVVDAETSRQSALRKRFQPAPILHANISCKWTLRSDRAQNARTEALNMVRNRKGRLPHIVVVTAEPMPSRIASLALGTGDIDCVYHFALYELQQSVHAAGAEDAAEMLQILISGKRLKDISDLPLDLLL